MTTPTRSAPLLSALLSTLLLAACASQAPQRLPVIGGAQTSAAAAPGALGASARADDAVACRAEVDRVYAAQNRADLSTRDDRDTPFAANYLPGVTTRGLGASYGRENMLKGCLANAAGRSTPANGSAVTGGNPGPTFNPTVR